MSSMILAIAAHPGDALFTMGATVAQHVASGGHGAVREVTDFILHSKGLLDALQES